MRVVAHAPASWFLLEHDGSWLLDVAVSRRMADWTVTLPLAPDEVAAWQAEGLTFIDRLAARVQARPRAFDDRNEAARWNGATVAAVRAWRAASTA